jgi:hypothetical protein
MERLPLRDRIILGMLGFFILMAFTIELHWLRHGPTLVAEAQQGDWLAKLWSVYGATDAMYYDRISAFSRTLESINVYFSQILNAALIYAIVKRKPWRHPLQLMLGAYLSYSVIVYFMEAHLSGYANMSNRTGAGFLLYYGVNLPWLIGHLYMVYDSFVATTRRFRQPAPM